MGRLVLPAAPSGRSTLPRLAARDRAAAIVDVIDGPRDRPGGLRGIVSNAGEVARGLGPGLARFALDIASDPVALGIPTLGLGTPVALGVQRLRGMDPSLTRTPALDQVGESFLRTGGRIANPGRYVDAYKSGDLFGAGIEDLSNIALLGAIASKPLTAGVARAASSATGAEAAARGIGELVEGAAVRAATETAATARGAAARAVARYETAERLAGQGRRLGATPDEIARLTGEATNAFDTSARSAFEALQTERPLASAIELQQAGIAQLGPATEAATAARAAATRAAATPAARAGVQAARLARLDPVSATLRGTGRLIRGIRGVFPERAAVTAAREAGLPPPVGSRAAGKIIRGINEQVGVRQTVNFGDLSGRVNRAFAKLDDTQRQAVVLLANESFTDPAVRSALRAVPGRAQAVLDAASGGKAFEALPEAKAALHEVSPDAVALVDEHLSGRTTPEAAAALDEATTTLREYLDNNTARMAGEGRLTEAHTGDQVNTARIEADKSLVKTRKKIERVSKKIIAREAEVARLAARSPFPSRTTQGAMETLGLSERATAQAARLRTEAAALIDENVVLDGTPAQRLTQSQARLRQADKLNTQAARQEALAERSTAAVPELASVPAGTRAQMVIDRPPERTYGRGAQAGVKMRTLAEAEQRLIATKVERGGLRRREALRVEKLWNDLANVPARFRPGLIVARKAHAELDAAIAAADSIAEVNALTALQAELPVTLKQMVERGINPSHIIGGLDPAAARLGPRRYFQARGSDTLPSMRPFAAELERSTNLSPATPRGVIARTLEDFRNFMATKAAETLAASDHAIPATRFGKTPAEQIANATEHGYTAWDPKARGGVTSTITEETIFLPSPMVREHAFYFSDPAGFELSMQKFFDPVRRSWKDMVLPFSAQWHAGNTVGNTIMATAGTGSLDWFSQIGEATRRFRSGKIEPRLHGTTIDHQFFDELYDINGTAVRAGIRGWPRRFINRSYAFNAAVDNITREAIFLSETSRNVATGMTPEAAATASIDRALTIAGDFSNMTRIEQQVFRRAVPFYGWLRHVTRLTGDLAVNHPSRLAWTLNISQLYGQGDSDFLGGTIPVAGGVLSLGSMNPLGAAADLYTGEGGVFRGALRSLGPEWKLLAAATTGMDLSQGGAQITRPYGTGDLDKFGRFGSTPLLTRPKELLYQIAQTSPLTRQARNLVTGDESIARYGSGEPILRGNEPIVNERIFPGPSRLGALAATFGVPTPTTFDVEAVQATAARRRGEARQARLRYERRRDQAGV